MDRKFKGLIVLFVIFFSSFSLLFSTTLSFAKPVGKEKALKAANTFLNAEKIREERKLTKIIAKQAQETISLKGFASSKIQEIRDKNGKILAYVTELKPEGFIITSADDNIRPIIGYSFKGKFPFQDSKENVLLHLAKWDIEARLKTLDSESASAKNLSQGNKSLWSEYTSTETALLKGLSSTTQWGPLINNDPNLTWDQGDPLNPTYNKFCPKDPAYPLSPGRRSLVGCSATAMAQIINYWAFPPSVSFHAGDRYTSWHHYINLLYPIRIDEDSSSYNFPSFDDLNAALSVINYTGDPNEKAYLSFAAGIKNHMAYSSYRSGALLSADAYKNGFYYGSATCKAGIYASGIGGGLNWTDYEAIVIENIQKEWPVEISLHNIHTLIVDGYRSTGESHLNFGWGGYRDLWYFLPNVIDWNTVTEIIYNICPYPGWGQYGGDSKNTRRTRYNGPEDHKVKWIVDTSLLDAQTDLATAIVGSSGNVYAFCQAMNSSDPGKFFIITPHGEILNDTSIPNPANIASEPAQASSFGLPIYIAFDNKVYRISLDVNVEMFYEDPDHRIKFVYPTQVDSHGNVYISGPWKLRSLDLNGNLRWEKTFALGGSMSFVAGIAIDEDRTRVYAKYYDDSTDTAHIWALNKYTGDEIWDVPVPAVASPMAAAGEPTVGDDGTVFARFFTSLRAYNPDSSMKWDYTVNTGQEYLEPFVSLGPNANIYICGANIASTPKHAWIRSLKTSDKTLLWEFTKEYPSDASSYDFRAPVVAYDNNMIYAVFHELSSPGYRKLYALKENVSGLTEMWEHEGADCILLGSTGAAYLLDRESEKIIALSGGEVGDPDGAGMAYTNNIAPTAPTNPSPQSGVLNLNYEQALLLSWTCSDPEVHALKYNVYIGEGDSGTIGLYAKDLNEPNYVFTNLRPGTGYLWKVVATDGQAIAEGPTWAFATKPAKTDLNSDGKVNFVDFAFIANYWMNECLEPNWCSGCDLDHSGVTDTTDLSIFAGTWLKVISCNYRVVNIRQLTDGVIGESGCAFNADGTKVAYRNFHPPYSWNYCDIWTMNTNGSSQTQITTASNGEFNPSFLPDGRITYTKEFGGNDYDIWMVNANGSNPHSFIGGSYRQQSSCWHPNGNKIVYESEYQYAGPTEIWTADSNGSNKIKLTDHTTDGYAQSFPIYSRSGSLIAYASPATSSAEYHIWVMNANGSNKQQITLGDKTQYPMFWWPDDSRIGYTENGKVYLRDIANGTDQLLLEIPGATIDECDLSTDGTKLVFALSDGSEFHIWIGDVICEP